jgi:type II secretion system protein I
LELKNNFFRNPQGFTLLEVLIAMAIMALALSSILSVESGSINASARAKQMNIVAMLVKNQMIKTEYEIEGKSFDEVEKEKSEAFEAPYESPFQLSIPAALIRTIQAWIRTRKPWLKPFRSFYPKPFARWMSQ